MMRVDLSTGDSSRAGGPHRYRLDLPAHRRRRRSRPHRCRHPLLRDVRRAVLPRRQGPHGRRRRQQRSRGGTLPHAVRRPRHRGPSDAEADGQQAPPGQGDEPPQDVGSPGHVGDVVQRERFRQARVDHAVAAMAPRQSTTRPARSSSSDSTPTRVSSRTRSTSTPEDSSSPIQFRTNVDGIFAAGDVRSGSTKQIASAVGEGAAVAIQIRYYLDSLDRVPVNS